MDELLSKFIRAKSQLDLFIQYNLNKEFIEKFNFDFPIEFKHQFINNPNLIICHADFLNKKLVYCQQNNYSNDEIIKNLEFVVDDNFPDAELFRDCHELLFDYIKNNILHFEIIQQNNNFIDDLQFQLRPNQLKARENMISQNFKSGIHSQIMGAGKSIIIIDTIQQHFNKYRENKIYIMLTERLDIFQKMFFIGNKLNMDHLNEWKLNGIFNFELFDIIDGINNKNLRFDSIEPKHKPVLLIINNAYLRINVNYKKLNNVSLVLSDECHSVSGPQNYNMLKWFKYNVNASIIGFSATPLRQTKNSAKQLIDIYSIDKEHLNIISNYTLIDALKDGIILPFKHIIIEPKYEDGKHLKDDFIKSMITKYIKNNNELPYKKGVSWTRRINDIKYICDTIKDILPDFDIYKHHSGTNNDEFDAFCDKPNNSFLQCVNCCKEGSDIKNLDFAIYLDGVKKRSTLVSLQTAGRVMRPDKEGKKKYAFLVELIKMDGEEGTPIEVLSVRKVIEYYKNILNLAITEEDMNIDDNIIDDFMKLFVNTYIVEEKSEIHINVAPNVPPCIIQLDLKTIDWDKFREYLTKEVRKITKQTVEDEFMMIINKLKKLDQFKIDNDYWLEYSKLDTKILGIPNAEEFREKYEKIFETKTWYDILGTKFNYYSFDDMRIVFQRNNKKINKASYDNLMIKNKKIPKYPAEYYKFKGWTGYENLLDGNDLFV